MNYQQTLAECIELLALNTRDFVEDRMNNPFVPDEAAYPAFALSMANMLHRHHLEADIKELEGMLNSLWDLEEGEILGAQVNTYTEAYGTLIEKKKQQLSELNK